MIHTYTHDYNRVINELTLVGHHGVNFYEVKETNTDTLHLVEDQLVELEHHDNQEIEVQ